MSNEPDTVNSGALATMIVLVALSTLGVALVVTALVRDETNRLEADSGTGQSRSFESLWYEQEAKMNAAPSWVDREEGIARIPVPSAMEIVLENVRQNPYELSPGTPLPEEEEEEEEGVGEDAAPGESDEQTDEAEDKPEGDGNPAPEGSALDPKTPAPKGPSAPAPTPAPKPAPATAPAPAPAPKPAPAPAPAPGGPAQ